MVTVRPAILSKPTRTGPTFLSTVNITVPLPLYVVPEVMTIQLELLTAVHGQPGGAVTGTVPTPPLGPNDCRVVSKE